MKALSLALGLMAAEFTNAAIKTPYDCYGELPAYYGLDEGNRYTDLFIMTGLDAYKAKLNSIMVCMPESGDSIESITSIWGDWDGKEWSNLQKLNSFGQLPSFAKFSDDEALQAAGLSAL